MADIEIKSKTWPGALRELQIHYRRNDPTTRKILRWLNYTWLPRCEKNKEERVKIEKEFQSGKMPLEEYEKQCAKFEDKFTREELMKDIGLDFLNRNDYHAVAKFFQNERTLTAQVLKRFSREPRWEEMKKDRSIEDIWWEFIQVCLTWGIFPVYSDPSDDNYNKLLRFADWRLMFESFRRRVKSEVESKTELIKAVEADGRGLPLAAGLSHLSLPSNPFLSLPEPRICPECGMPFSSDKDLVDHYQEKHSKAELQRHD